MAIMQMKKNFGRLGVIFCLLILNWTFDAVHVTASESCSSKKGKKSFPNLDYAFFGYNVLRGYPLATGVDPGLTRPIFKHDYTERKQSADCRHSVPKGYVVVPDVSCVTSFTSETIKDSKQLSKSLSAQVEASGGGWGVSFSASADYKKATAEMFSKESIFVQSKAKCDYYYAMFDNIHPPEFSESFIRFVSQLQSNKINSLFDLYGTHFIERVTFGARFVYQHRIKTADFSELESSTFSVTAQASYAGAFNVAGGFGMTNDQQDAAQSFSNKAETTTISVGAPPPANGDTMTWASTVKENPIPTKLKLKPIELLFTEKYMAGLNLTTPLEKLHKSVTDGKSNFCEDVLLRRGEAIYCGGVNKYYDKISNISLLGNKMFQFKNKSMHQCMLLCERNQSCIYVIIIDNGCQTVYVPEFRDGGKYLEFTTFPVVHDFANRIYPNRLFASGHSFTFNGMYDNVGLHRIGHPLENVSSNEECEMKCTEVRCKVYIYDKDEKKCTLHYYFPIRDGNLRFKENCTLTIVGI